MIERDAEVDLAERRVVWAPWSPAQLVALAFGVFYVILGAVVLANTGIHASSFNNAHVGVWGFQHTPLLAVVELGYGLLLILAGATPGAGRGLMAFLGVVALGFGVVVLAQSGSLYGSLGVQDANGWLYIVTGAVTIAAGMFAPVIFGRNQHTVGYRDDLLHHGRL